MTDQELTLAVKKRETGKQAARALPENEVKGIVYGKSLEPIAIAADYNPLHKIYNHAGGNQIVTLEVGSDEPHDVLFKDVDYHPVTNRIRHFDLYAVTKGEKVTVDVPLVMTSEAPAEKAGLNVVLFIDSVEVETIPRKIPEQLEVSADSLVEIGDTITIADLTDVDEEITILAEADATIAKVEEIQELQVEDDSPDAEMPDAENGEAPEGEEGEGDDAAAPSDSEKPADSE